MSVQIAWEDDDKKVLRFDLDSTWTWEEFFIAKDEGYDLMSTVSHKIGVLVNIDSRTALKPNILSNTRKALSDKHPNTYITVIVVADAFTRTTISQLYSAIRMSSNRVEIVSSIDEARAMILHRLQSLQDDTAKPSH